MKILFIIDALFTGGKERQLLELLKGLQTKRNIKFQTIILSDNIHYNYAKNLNIKLFILKRKIKTDPRIFIKLYQICKEFQPDIVHSWESMCSVYALPIAKILGLKFINGTIRNAPLKLKMFEKAWIYSKLTFSFSDVILANSYAGLKSYNVPRHKSYCVHNGFDSARITNLEDCDSIRKLFKINTPKIVGTVANFTPKKDYETYIQAALLILQKRTDVTFLAVGDGCTLDEHKKMVNQRFQDKIEFLGKQRDIESIVNIFDVGVLATIREGISNSIMEYMALAKPVVATQCEGNKEIVIDHKTGFLVEPKNVEEMAERIEFLLDNKEIAEAMGKAGKERLLKDFSVEKMTERHIELYESVLGTFHRTSRSIEKESVNNSVEFPHKMNKL